MDKEIIKKLGVAALVIVAIVLILSTFFKSDDRAVLGKWELAPTEESGKGAYEFYKDNTGIQYDIAPGGDTYNAEAFSYRLDGSNLTIIFGNGVSRIYPYEISGKNLLINKYFI